MLDHLAQVPPLTLLIIAITILGSIAIILFLIRELNITFGNKSISFRSSSKLIQIITDYADFKYQLKEEEVEGLRSLQAQARRTTRNYLNLLTQDLIGMNYNVSQLSKTPRKAAITKKVLPFLISECESIIFRILMEIFDENHLTDLSPEKFRELVSERYKQLYSRIKGYFRTAWLPEFYTYKDFEVGLDSVVKEFESVLFKIMIEFKSLSCQKIRLKDALYSYDQKVKLYIQTKGKLPDNYMVEVENLYSNISGVSRKVTDDN